MLAGFALSSSAPALADRADGGVAETGSDGPDPLTSPVAPAAYVGSAAVPPADNVLPIADNEATCALDGGWRPGHTGVDCFSPGDVIGAPIVAVEAGTITGILRSNGKWSCGSSLPGQGGQQLYLVGDSGTVYYYGHLDLINVNEGTRVGKGVAFAYMGKSGEASCPGRPAHLHFEIKPNGIDGDPVDPKPFMETWGRATEQAYMTPTNVTGELQALANIGSGAPNQGTGSGSFSASGYNGLFTIRTMLNGSTVPLGADSFDPTSIRASSPGAWVTASFPVAGTTSICGEAYALGGWHPIGCKNLVTGAVSLNGDAMSGRDGSGSIKGTVALSGWSAALGVRVRANGVAGPLQVSSAGSGSRPFVASFNTASTPGMDICVEGNSFGLWKTLGCLAANSGTVSTFNTSSGASGTVNNSKFNGPIGIRVFMGTFEIAFTYSSGGSGSRAWSVNFNVAPGNGPVCIRADSWGYLQTLQCKNS